MPPVYGHLIYDIDDTIMPGGKDDLFNKLSRVNCISIGEKMKSGTYLTLI